MSDNQENPMGNNPETSLQWPDGFNEDYTEEFQAQYVVPHSPRDTRDEYENHIYWDPQKSGEVDETVQQSSETSNNPYQWVTAYLDSLWERVEDLPGGEEDLRADEDMNRVTDIENRVWWRRQEMTIQDVYFLRKYDTTKANFGHAKGLRIRELLQDRDPEADLDMMLENFDHAKLARNMMEGGFGYNGMETLAENLRKFQSDAVNHAELAHRLVNKRREDILADNLEKFHPEAIDDYKLARHMMGVGEENALARNLNKFPNDAVDHSKLAHRIINKDDHVLLAENLEKFLPGTVDRIRLAEELRHKGVFEREVLARNLHKFQPDIGNAAPLARDLLDEGMVEVVVRNLDEFKELPADVRDRIANRGIGFVDPDSPLT